MKFFDFSDSAREPQRDSPQRDRLYKIRPLVDHFSNAFRRAFTPHRDICIDESLLLFKGRIIFRQYTLLKRARFGIKLFCLTDKHGHLHTFRVISRKDDPISIINNQIPPKCTNMSVTSKLTIALLKNFLGKGYHLYIDNWYSSVPLLKYLLQQQTICTSTTRSNRVPKILKARSCKRVYKFSYERETLSSEI